MEQKLSEILNQLVDRLCSGPVTIDKAMVLGVSRCAAQAKALEQELEGNRVVIETIEYDEGRSSIVQIRLTETQEKEIIKQLKEAREKGRTTNAAITYPSHPAHSYYV